MRTDWASAGVLCAFLGLAVLPGCAILSPATVETTKAVLSKLPAELPRRAPHGAVLVVLPPQTRPLYDTTQMAYTVKPYEVAYFSQHEWGETPSQMLQPLLVRTLQETGFFSAVLTPPQPGRYSHALRTEVRELVADFTSEPPVLQLELRFVLTDGAAGRILATRDVAIREPMKEKSPYAAVVAANDATAKALLELASFVLEKAG